MKITEQAKDEIQKALEGFNKPGSGIHILSAQGCCGPSIQMDIATHVGNGETALIVEGIDFFVTNDLLPAMADITIEYGSNGFRLNGLKKNSGGCCG